MRDLSTFPAFPRIAGLAPQQLDAWINAVEVKPVSAMEWDWPRHWIISPRVVYDDMYFWIASGSGVITFTNPAQTIRFRAGDLLLIPQGMEHAIEGTSTEEPRVFAVHFFATLFGGINFLKMMGFPRRLPHRQGAPYGPASERLAREFAVKAPGWVSAMQQEIFHILLYAVRHEPALFEIRGSLEAQPLLPRFFPVLDWIDRNLSCDNITVAHLAGLVCISETHFRRLFQRVFEMSPIQFVRKRRIERACTLLRTTEMPIKQVAQSCGFAEDAFFSRVFRRLVGVAPAAYRRGEYPPSS